MRKILFLLAVFALAVAAPVYAANISGTWALTMTGPQGEENFDVTVKDNGGNLEVAATHPMLQEMVGTGTLKGNDINFSLKATGQMAVELKFAGKVDGKKMEGTREIVMASGGSQGGPGGGESGAPAGGGQGAPPSGGAQGGPPGGGEGGGPSGGGPGGDMSSIPNAWKVGS